MDTTSLINHLLVALLSVIGAVVTNTVTPPVTFEVGSGFIWGMGFGIIAGTALWADSNIREDKKIRIVPLFIVVMLSAAAGFIGYTALSAANLSALVITGGTTVCGMLGGPGLRVVCERGLKELIKYTGDPSPKSDQDKTDNTDKKDD